MARRAFAIGGWVALVIGVLAGAAAAAVVVTGALAAAGKVTYPAQVGLGPLSFHQEVTMPASFAQEVCRSADIATTEEPGGCLRLFVHPADWSGGRDGTRTQDADIRPTAVRLTGTVELASARGWNWFVVVSVLRAAVGLGVVCAVLLLLARLLSRAAAGAVFSLRAVTYVRSIGWLLIAGSLAGWLLGLYSDPSRLGYQVEAFGGAASSLVGVGDGSLDLTQIVFGGLVLLLAEVFRHGAAVEDEQRLTV